MDDTKVFVNCPFDDNFFPLLKCLLFTIIYADLDPQIAETSDSGEARLDKIVNLMKASKFSIHDLSRVKPLKRGGLPRFNMPFECGIDFGLRLSDESKFNGKKFLILGEDRETYRKFISDISGNDIRVHGSDPEQMIKAVRDWFKTWMKKIPWHQEIWLAYNEFEYFYERVLTDQGYDPKSINAVTFSDVIDLMKLWIPRYKSGGTNS